MQSVTYRVVELLLEDGSSPYADWFATLDPVAAAKVTVAKVRIAQGNFSNVEWFRGIGEKGEVSMALTRDFKETVVLRVKSEPAFAQALLDEALTLLLNGDPQTAKLILRDLVNATIGFEVLAGDLLRPSGQFPGIYGLDGPHASRIVRVPRVDVDGCRGGIAFHAWYTYLCDNVFSGRNRSARLCCGRVTTGAKGVKR